MQSERSIPLTPSQAIKIHGWTKPMRWLSWKDHVSCRKDLTFGTLVEKMGLSDATLEALHTLQPDIHAWIASKKVTLEDCEVLHKFWDVHPFRDFTIEDTLGVHQVKIADILIAGLSFDALYGCNVTLEDLAEGGLTPENMKLFQFNLHQWKMLGFNSFHASKMTPAQIGTVFNVTPQILESSFMY